MAGGPSFLLIQTSISLPNRAACCPPAGCYRLTNPYRHPAKIFPKTSLGDRFNQTIDQDASTGALTDIADHFATEALFQFSQDVNLGDVLELVMRSRLQHSHAKVAFHASDRSMPELLRTEIANAVQQTTETGEPISVVDRFIFA